MPTFIDESGDTGSARRGGKPYFRLGAVWVPTLDHAQALREAIRRVRRDLGLRDDYEFKFAGTHMRPKERRAFFQMAMTGEFRFTVCSIDKTSNDWNSARGTELHWACATTLAVYLQPIYHEAEKLKCPLREPIIVDSNSDSRFLLTVQRAFRGLESKVRHGSSLVGRVTFRKSKPDEMIQLADMVLGAVGTHLDRQDSTWYEMIAARELKTISLP